MFICVSIYIYISMHVHVQHMASRIEALKEAMKLAEWLSQHGRTRGAVWDCQHIHIYIYIYIIHRYIHTQYMWFFGSSSVDPLDFEQSLKFRCDKSWLPDPEVVSWLPSWQVDMGCFPDDKDVKICVLQTSWNGRFGGCWTSPSGWLVDLRTFAVLSLVA